VDQEYVTEHRFQRGKQESGSESGEETLNLGSQERQRGTLHVEITTLP
jgi:hypothetical protein